MAGAVEARVIDRNGQQFVVFPDGTEVPMARVQSAMTQQADYMPPPRADAAIVPTVPTTGSSYRFGDVGRDAGNEALQAAYAQLASAVNPQSSNLLDVATNYATGTAGGLLSGAIGLGQKAGGYAADVLGAGAEALGSDRWSRGGAAQAIYGDMGAGSQAAGLGTEANALGLLSELGAGKYARGAIADRLNQTGPVPTMYSNPIMRAPFDMGRGIGDNGGPALEALPVMYDRQGAKIADRLSGFPSARFIAGKDPIPAGSGMTNVGSAKSTALSGHQSRGILANDLVNPDQIDIADLKGQTLMGIVGDHSGRHIVTGVNNDAFDVPVDTQGGFQYIDRQNQGYAGAKTATKSKFSEAEKTENPFYISLLMGEQSPDFAMPTGQIFGEMFKKAPIASKDVATIDDQIRKIGMSVIVNNPDGTKYSKTIYPFVDFKSVSDPSYIKSYIEGLPTGTQRANFLKGLDKAGLQKLGVPKVSDARAAMADENQIGMDWGSTGYRGFTPDLQKGMIETTPDQSLTYSHGVDKIGNSKSLTGEGMGIPYALTFPDLASELRAKGSGGGIELTSPAYKVFEGSPKRSKQLVNDKVIDLVSTFRGIEDKFGREAAMRFAQDTLKEVNVTKSIIDAARKANAPNWVMAMLAPTGAGLLGAGMMSDGGNQQ